MSAQMFSFSDYYTIKIHIQTHKVYDASQSVYLNYFQGGDLLWINVMTLGTRSIIAAL